MRSIVPFFCCILLLSCSNEGLNGDAGLAPVDLEMERAKIIGEWTVVKWVNDGESIDMNQGRGLSIIFKEDGTHLTIGHFEGEPDQEVSREKWNIHTNDSIHFFAEFNSSYAYRFSGDTLILEGTFDGSHDMVYHIRKEK